MPSPIPQANGTRRVVVALGGNAISRPGGDDSVLQDLVNLDQSLGHIVDLIGLGYQVILTHGNGPQVGNQMIRVELARGKAPELPLDVVVADLQGGLGYMIELVLRNQLTLRGLNVPVCALLTLVEVDPLDPAMLEPTKFVGPAYAAYEVEALTRDRGWRLKEDRGRGFRRVVASPKPRGIVERDLIESLIAQGAMVIVTGGGGIPVARTAEGLLKGVEAVIDKDFASAVLARDVGAEELFILTGVERVALHYGSPEETWLDRVTAAEAREYLAQGHFPAGSMGPKIEAACQFVENGGKRALITDIFTLAEAIEGKTGTQVVP